ncbi:MAG: hypothetical protein HZA50_14940 [Planctomycetes bacterium]|nr:hypothetical protein [Planctomycetota bacterium]
MADMLEQASDWLDAMRLEHLSHPVLYCRGGDSLEIAATVGQTLFEIDNGFGVIERVESRDFLVSVSALVLNGVQVEPQPGDIFREASGSKVLVYEVMAPGKEPCWRYSDPYRRVSRIHTKLIGQEG